MDQMNYKRTKYACYFTYLAMSSVFSLPPLLFATFREMYGISYTLLGTLVLVNFCTQLGIDLIFSFFSRHFNIHKTIRLMPLLTAAGLCVYASIPLLFPQYAYAGLVAGTVLFSVAAGLAEVLVSPTVAALPSDTSEKDLSMLHSLYGYGFVGVVLVSTLFLNFVGNQYWMYLTFFWAVLPVIASVLLMAAKLPDMNMEHSEAKAVHSKYRAFSSVWPVSSWAPARKTPCRTGYPSILKRRYICRRYGEIFSVCRSLPSCSLLPEPPMRNSGKTFPVC